MFSVLFHFVSAFVAVDFCQFVLQLLMLRLSNTGRVLSAVSLTRLCAVIVKDLPALCSDPPTGCMLCDRAVDSLVRQSAVSQLTEHEVRYVRVFLKSIPSEYCQIRIRYMEIRIR